MRRILATAVATIIAGACVTATAVPASAGGIYFGFGHGFGGYGFHSGYGYGHHVVEVPVYDEYYGDDPHTTWCKNHYKTYDEYSNLYYYKPGYQKACVSPHG